MGKSYLVDSELEEYIDFLLSDKKVNNKVLLINPPQFDYKTLKRDTVEKKGYYSYQPTGLLFLASVLLKAGIDVQILDMNFELLWNLINQKDESLNLWKDIITNKLRGFNPSIIGISCMFTHMRTIYEDIFKYFREEKLVVLAGGTHSTFEYESLLKEELCHFVITHDGEKKLPYLISRLLNKKNNMEPCGGIFYKHCEGIHETKGNDSLPDITNEDIVKAYELIHIDKYSQVGSLNQYSRIIGNDKPFCALSMNRGCRGSCTFCSVRTLFGDRIRYRSTDVIISELQYFASKGIKHFDWLDDDLLANKERCIELFTRMIKEKLNLNWYANNGIIAASLDERLLHLMVESGCIGFKIGIESGNVEMLKKICKPATVTKLLEVSEMLKAFPKLSVAGNYIIGFPEEKFSQMLDTFLFSNKMELDWSGFYICQPLKGAKAFDSFEALGDERCRKRHIDNYMPVREDNRENQSESEPLYRGLDIFILEQDQVVLMPQLKEIWFVFGFITNFISNKNLSSCENVWKFIQWVTAAMDAYPYDAGMALFLYFGHVIGRNPELAEKYFLKAKELHEGSSYWQERFEQFGLQDSIKRFMTYDEVLDFILKVKTKIWAKINYSLNN